MEPGVYQHCREKDGRDAEREALAGVHHAVSVYQGGWALVIAMRLGFAAS
jgi:hypothetical protein